jgi:hypothetical protein
MVGHPVLQDLSFVLPCMQIIRHNFERHRLTTLQRSVSDVVSTLPHVPHVYRDRLHGYGGVSRQVYEAYRDV